MQLKNASVAVLLISKSFLNSKYIADHEMPVLINMFSNGDLKILPIIISPSLVDLAVFEYNDLDNRPQEFKLTTLQFANRPENPLVDMSEAQQDKVFIDVANQIKKHLET